jgi:hypothetical protein
MRAADIEADIKGYFAAREQPEAPCGRWEQLARHVARELDGPEATQTAEHIGACAECRRTLQELEQTAHAWAAPREAVVLTFPRMVRLFAPAVALAAGLLAIVLVTRPAPPDDRLMPKGRAAPSQTEERLAAAAWSLEVAVQRGDRQFRAPSGSTLRAGDQLGLFYSAATDGYLIVLYADDHAPPVRIFPAQKETSARIAPGQNVRLSDGATLAEGQGCEWLVGLFTRTPLPATQADALVRKMVERRAGCTLTVPPGAQAEAAVVVVNR